MNDLLSKFILQEYSNFIFIFQMLRLVLDITTEIIATKNQENDSSNTKMVQCHEINQNQFVSENTSQKSGMQ